MREKELIKRMMPTKDIAGAEMILPNTSGDHVRGIKRAVPVADADLANKKYVDDSISSVIHSRQHSITQTLDHTSTATAGQMLKADANGLPVNATNTDAAVAAAVTASHTQNTDTKLDNGGANEVTAAQAKTAYTHSQDNSQAHSDYLLNTGDTATGDYTFDTNTLKIDATNHRIGICTTSPTFPLSLAASTGSKIALYDNGDVIQYGFGIQSNLLQIFADTNTDRVGIGYGTSAAFSETLTIKGNYVGIGDTTPSCALDVTGKTQTQALTIATGGGVYEAGCLGYTDANWGFLHRPPQAGANAAHHFEKSDGTDLMSIGEDGDVGIGIVNPNSKFEVVTGATDGRQAISIDQNDEDVAFIDFQGTSAADATKNISTAASSAFTYVGMIKVEINGTARWIPYYQPV